MPRTKQNKKRDIEHTIGYEFRNKKLLLEALTHKSYYHENKTKTVSYNERLEFLGDSVISLIIVEYLFRHEHRYAESVLAKMKSYLVSESVLAGIARSIHLGDSVFFGKGEEATGGRDKQSILADALEALVGAVYLDGGYDKTGQIVLALFEDIMSDTMSSGDFCDYKTELQEMSQSLCGALPEYRVIRQRGEEHKRVFTVAVFLEGKKLGIASGRRKKEAEILAARKALEKIQLPG
jgi:ribonuclease-3